MRLGISIPFYKRHDVTRQVFRLIRSYGTDDLLVAVGSRGAISRNLAHSEGWQYVEAPNHPLGLKRAMGLDPMRGKVDGVLILSSEDFITREFLERKRQQLQQYQAVACKGLVFYYQNQFWAWPGYKPKHRIGPMGPGRLFRADFLDDIGWDLFPRHKRRGLDQRAWWWVRDLLQPWEFTIEDIDYGLVNWKGSDAMNSWEATLRTGLPPTVVPANRFSELAIPIAECTARPRSRK